jgi:hypothetical protein
MGIVGSIFQGIFGSNAANHAADTQANAANNAANLQHQDATDALNFSKQQYGNSLNLLAPYYNTGVSANSRLGYLMGLNPAQGLPAGVINPNAPQTPSGGALDGSQFDPNALNSLRALRGGGNGGPMPIQANAAMLQPGQNPFGPSGGTPNGNPNGLPGQVLQTGGGGNQFNMNPPITSPGTNPYQIQMRPPIMSGGTTSGAAGLLGANGQPQPEPPQPGLGTIGSSGNLGDPSPFPNGMGNLQTTGNVQNASGAPGQVPQTGNGADFGQTGGFLGDQAPTGGINFGGGPNNGSFGSLAQGWNQTFNSPTGVTEQNDPGYQFRLQQGQNALQNSAAARGGLLTGGTAKALSDYNQNAASGEYGNVYNRALQNYNTNYNTFTNDQTNLFNRLSALSGQGQVSANNLSNAGLGTANNVSNTLLTSGQQIGNNINNAGAATASGYINSANAINGAVSNGTNSLSALLAMFGGG